MTSWLHIGGHNGPVIAVVTMPLTPAAKTDCASVKTEALRRLHAGTLEHDPLFTRDQLLVLLPWTNVYMAPADA